MRIVCKLIIVKPKIGNIHNKKCTQSDISCTDCLFYYFFYMSLERLEILPQLFCNMYMPFIPVLDKITN